VYPIPANPCALLRLLARSIVADLTGKPMLSVQPIAKTCPCCRTHYTPAGWRALPSVGQYQTEDETGRYLTELRNCPCGSTIATEVKL
jgi:hypothetical protein